MAAKYKIGEIIRIPHNKITGADIMVIGLVTSQKELLEYYELKNDENFPEDKNDCVIYSEETSIEKVWNNFLGNWVYEDDILDADEVFIKNNIDPHCKVWHNDKCVGVIKNETALDDFMVQLSRKYLAGKDTSGYSVEFNSEKIPVRFINGMPQIKQVDGFYDHHTKCLDELLGI